MAKKKKKKKHLLLKSILFLILLIGLILAYAHFVEPKLLKVNDYIIKSNKITDNFNGFKIVHISDIHYGRMYDDKDLEKLVNKINEYKPDIVVLTGDLIDRDTTLSKKNVTNISKILAKIDATIGKYAITGNHDYNFDEWEAIIKSGGFTNLNNTYETIYNGGYDQIVIAGVSTMQYDNQTITERCKDATDYINSFEKDGPIYNILLMHEPDYIDKLENNKFNLVLAGHTHGGQIRVPFYGAIVLPDDGKKYSSGKYTLTNNEEIYVSTGIGVSNINARLFDMPSFNVYRLIKK